MMTQTQFPIFRQRSQRLLNYYAASLGDEAIQKSLDLQVHQLLREYAPDSLFEKRLTVQESQIVLASALDFYKALLCGPNSG